MIKTKLTRDSFHVFQANAKNALKQSEQVPSVLICAGTGCIAGGSMRTSRPSARIGVCPFTWA